MPTFLLILAEGHLIKGQMKASVGMTSNYVPVRAFIPYGTVPRTSYLEPLKRKGGG